MVKKQHKNTECNKNVTFPLQAFPFFGDNVCNFLNLLLGMFEVGKFHDLPYFNFFTLGDLQMNKTIKLAVAGAVLSAASIANAGIIIPAGEWTLDVNGNVNHFAIMDNRDNTPAIAGGLATTTGGVAGVVDDRASMNTGLLPAWLGFTGTTRQNDLDVSFTISMQPGTSTNGALAGGNAANAATENRQAFLTFGDKSWGSVKLGKDLGVFGSDAILSDMTLLGVGATGAGTGNGTTTTLGHIGTGYIYADWTGQIAYTTPNMNGFQATAAIVQPWAAGGLGGAFSATSAASMESFGFQAKASYTMEIGKVWAGYMTQDFDTVTNAAAAALNGAEMNAAEIGATVNFGNASLTAYYYTGEGVGTTGIGLDGIDFSGVERDSDGAFVQATYVIPSGTKLGVSYGRSDLDASAFDVANNVLLVSRNEMWTVGAYHPLTKHLNLVAEYNDSTSESMNAAVLDNESDSFSVGAILFF